MKSPSQVKPLRFNNNICIKYTKSQAKKIVKNLITEIIKKFH